MTLNRSWTIFLLTLAGPLIVLAIWELLSATATINPLFFPRPSSLIPTTRTLIETGQLTSALKASMLRVLLGFVIAAVPGVLLGVAMALWWPVRAMLNPIATAFFAIPKIAILPLVIIIFGIGETSKVAMVAVSVFFLVVLSTLSAVLEVEQSYFDAARNAGAGWWDRVRTVAIPGALPGIFAGLKIALGFSLLVIVGTEMLAAKDGIGYLIWNSYQTFAIEKMYVGLLVTALIGFLLNLVMDEVERVIIPWRAVDTPRAGVPIPETVQNWFMATRPLSFTASITPALVGTLLAAIDGKFSLQLFALVVIASVLVQAGSNLVNDYFDWKRGADGPALIGRGAFIQRGVIPAQGVFWFGIVLLAAATAIGFVIVYLVGWKILLFAIPSLAAAYFYTGGPKPLGYVALGEATVFLFMGPVIVLGSYFVQRQTLTWTALLVSIPIGLLVTAVLQANNIRDIEMDRAADKRTLATYIGRQWANREYVALLVGAYLMVIVIVIGGWLSAAILVVFLSLPRAIEVTRMVLHRDDAKTLTRALRQTAGVHLQFGLLLCAALALIAVT